MKNLFVFCKSYAESHSSCKICPWRWGVQKEHIHNVPFGPSLHLSFEHDKIGKEQLRMNTRCDFIIHIRYVIVEV